MPGGRFALGQPASKNSVKTKFSIALLHTAQAENVAKIKFAKFPSMHSGEQEKCCYSRAIAERSLHPRLHYARGLAGASLPQYILTASTICVTHMPLSIPSCAGISEKWPHGIYESLKKWPPSRRHGPPYQLTCPFEQESNLRKTWKSLPRCKEERARNGPDEPRV
jgi:hypothetical protein